MSEMGVFQGMEEVSQHKPTVRFSDSQAGSKKGVGRTLCDHPHPCDVGSLFPGSLLSEIHNVSAGCLLVAVWEEGLL